MSKPSVDIFHERYRWIMQILFCASGSAHVYTVTLNQLKASLLLSQFSSFHCNGVVFDETIVKTGLSPAR